jgi:hypothetical protein
MRISNLIWPILGIALASACSSSKSKKGSCADFSGAWTVDGTCVGSSSNCTFTQSGCSVTLACTTLDGPRTLKGTVDGTKLTLGDNEFDCTGTISDLSPGQSPSATGQCKVSGQTCDFNAQCETGKCTEAGSSGSGGSAGSSGRGGAGGSSGKGGFGGSSGSSGKGGSAGGPPVDPTCDAGARAVCWCLRGSEEECTTDRQQLLYQGCVEENPAADFVGCFADYVSGTSVDCQGAATNCIPED